MYTKTSNFNLFATQHSGSLWLTRPNDVQENASAALADSAEGFSIDLPTGQENHIEWSLSHAQKSPLSCVLFQRLNVSGASISVTIDIGLADPLFLAGADQVDDYLFVVLPSWVDSFDYDIVVTVPQDAASTFNCAAPFFGGEDLGSKTPLFYDNGRQASFAPQVEFQNTETTQVPHRLANFGAREYRIDGVDSTVSAQVFKFLSQHAGRLVLFVEHDARSAVDMQLGTLVVGASSRGDGELDVFNIAIQAKNSEY